MIRILIEVSPYIILPLFILCLWFSLDLTFIAMMSLSVSLYFSYDIISRIIRWTWVKRKMMKLADNVEYAGAIGPSLHHHVMNTTETDRMLFAIQDDNGACTVLFTTLKNEGWNKIKDGKIHVKDGKIHNDFGSAIISNNQEMYYLNGKRLTSDQWLRQSKMNDEDKTLWKLEFG